MIDINYELYKVFYHVASTLNFSEASKQLFISQSAVSQSIKTLEKKLDQFARGEYDVMVGTQMVAKSWIRSFLSAVRKKCS